MLRLEKEWGKETNNDNLTYLNGQIAGLNFVIKKMGSKKDKTDKQKALDRMNFHKSELRMMNQHKMSKHYDKERAEEIEKKIKQYEKLYGI